MDSTRFILLTALALVLMLLFQAWQRDYGVVPEPVITERGPVEPVPDTSLADQPDMSEIPTPIDSKETVQEELSAAKAAVSDEVVTINTDTFRLQISLTGAGIVRTELKQYPVSIDQPDTPFVLMDKSHDLFYVTQGGILSRADSPNHTSLFRVEKNEYTLAADKEVLEVPFIWSSESGISVRKIYVFQRSSHLISLRYEIQNNSSQDWNGQSYAQLKRNNPGRKSIFGGSYTYTGAVISRPESRYEKISFDDIKEQELKEDIVNGWVAMIQHYFVSALIPVNKAVPHHFYTMSQADGNYAIGFLTPAVTVLPGDTAVIEESIYAGPTVQAELEKITDGLELTVDYGVLWFLSKPLFWCLQRFHDLVGNWGWSIILLTFVLKLIFYPLSAAGFRSMAKMRKVQPRIMSLRERYKDDKARLNQAMMQIYKEEKINPLGGCLPILLQIPVFLALYWVLLESVEMRQAGFIFWLKDLSAPDPFYILPVLMGITMFVQQKLNPAAMDPVQAKVMSILPFVFTVMFAFFQSGLVLYWTVSNILSIAQQWAITRNLERSGLKPKNP